MAIMVDKGFLVDGLVPGTVHRPAFLSKRNQMPEVDVLKMQSIALLRVHVERMIRRVKENKLFDSTIPLSITGSIHFSQLHVSYLIIKMDLWSRDGDMEI
ncbi:hypothetical protein N1851_027111 [Merluccius polli]|uniref:DDE Tnp4 domain-containing protein n=1 Tax=Merluccius polli TaxID=89951 RepID=A0AA47MAL1_MERPO|nr:hypothetical protein N1851_027111 [Merluccius polli]